MRFNKGTKVEVLSKTDCVTGAWRCGEIISGNGRTYSVSFGRFPMTSDAVVDRVPRKLIRPCPPYVKGTDIWVPGDLVEVFDDLYWKTARVVKVIDGNNYLVRLCMIPTLQQLRVHSSHIRVRQCWQDDKWFIVGKGTENYITTSMKKKTEKQCAGEDYLLAEKNIESLEHQIVSAINRKRGSPIGSLHVDQNAVAAQKPRRSIEDGGDCQKFPGQSFSSQEKVDASVSPQKLLGGIDMLASFNIGTTVGRGQPNRFTDSFGAGKLVANDSDSCASSVASCSVTRSSHHDLPLNIPHRDNDFGSYCSDAESFCGRGCEDEDCSSHPKKGLGGEVPRSELGVYRCIVESWYAAEPLSWEEDDMRHARNLLSSNSRLIIT